MAENKFVGNAPDKLELLSDETKSFIGRKKALHSQHGDEGTLLLGRSVENENYGKKIYLDALNPHVIFITGSRGSGKSYALSVIAEELVTKNPNVACVIIDPVGIFWSMKYPNRDEKEVSTLADWGLEPHGLEQTRVFIPFGLSKKVPKETYDRLFSIRPAELNVDDWCLTFSIERFSQTGLLLERSIEKAREKHKNYSIEELIKVIETDKELTSKDKGYKTESRRALVSRLEAAKSWGIFSKEGTSLAEICKKGHASVIDISFLEENVASLVIGMLSRKILNARKMITRQETMKGYVEQMTDVDELLNTEVPPTWLFIDEAHTLIPSGAGKTAATDGLVEYVKQGRRPGCSLVFATQQPSAIDTKVLSQLDLLLCHKLVFDEDLKAVMHRMPTPVPKEYDNTRFVKTLPIGIALAGDRSDETSRAFCLQIRPRFSQHEGREVKTGEVGEKIDAEKVTQLIMTLIYKKIEESGRISLLKADETIDAIKRRYGTSVDNDKIIKELLKEKNCAIEGEYLAIPGFDRQKEVEEETGEKGFIEIKVSAEEAKQLAEKNRARKTLGLIGKEEKIKEIKLVYEPVFKISFNIPLEKGYKPMNVLISDDYELYYYDKGFKKTASLRQLAELKKDALTVLKALRKTNDKKRIEKETNLSAQAVGKYMNEITKQNLNAKQLPEKPDAKYNIDEQLKLGRMMSSESEKVTADEKTLKKIPMLFGECEITGVETLFKPFWKATYEDKNKDVRVQKFDAI